MNLTQVTLDQAIELGGLALTLISVLLDLFTLLEIRTDRKSSSNNPVVCTGCEDAMLT